MKPGTQERKAAIKKLDALRGSMACPHCGHVGKTLTHVKGSFAIEVVLWLFLLVPGVIYSIWRLTTKQQVCACCGNGGVIPALSPRGREIVARNDP